MLRLVSDEEMRGGEGAFGGEGRGTDMMGGGGGVAARVVLGGGGGGVAAREILGGGGAGTRMTSSSATDHWQVKIYSQIFFLYFELQIRQNYLRIKNSELNILLPVDKYHIASHLVA